MYKSLTIENPSFIKRFSHHKRFDIAANLLDLKSDDSYLDYGTGDGYFLLVLKNKYDNIKRIVGYEPVNSQFSQLLDFKESTLGTEIEIFNTLPIYSTFTKISCLEVLEHMSALNQVKLLNEIKSILTDDGLLVLSVPIETGLSGFIKNVLRILLRQKHANLTFKNFFKSTFFLKIDRPDLPYINSHVGFNHVELEKLFPNVGFKIEKCIYSPIPRLRNVINSQVFYVLKKNNF